MDIRVLPSGKIFYRIDPALGALLCESFPDKFVRLNAPVTQHQPAQPILANPMEPKFAVRQHEFNAEWIIQFSIGNRVENYFGPPEQAAAYFLKMGFPLPDDVAARYKVAKDNELTPDKALAIQEQQRNEAVQRAANAGIDLRDTRTY